MLVKKYRAKVVSLKNPFQGLYSVELASLNGKFKYEPGQFLHLAIDSEYDGSDQWPESRCFSLQSNPDESTIRITYTVKGRFTKLMEAYLKKNSEVWIKMPYGDLFSRPHSKINTVFIAGGTGVTPFISLFTHDSFKDYINPKVYLGFKTRSHNIYAEYLKEDMLKIAYEDLHGMLNIDEIFSENGNDKDYFISGPPSMIRMFKDRLFEYKVTSSQILTDDWE